MLVELAIKDLGVIDSSELIPAAGMTALTGETGAGKTMIVTGLGLIGGAKAGSGLIRHGCQRAIVEARFNDVPAHVVAQIEYLGGQMDDDELLVTRHITGSRSRIYLGGVQVPLSTAAEIMSELVTLHGQQEQVRLGSSDRQREILDKASGAKMGKLLDEYRQAWARRKTALNLRDQLVNDAQARARQIDMLEFGLQEIATVDPQPEEDVQLKQESQRLLAVDALRIAAGGALAALTGDELNDVLGAVDLLARARKELSKVESEDSQLAAIGQRLEALNYQTSDVLQELSSYLADLASDPLRLEAISQRLSALQQLSRKYGENIAQVLEWAQSAHTELEQLTNSDEQIEQLSIEIAQLDQQLSELAQKITALRQKTAAQLAKKALTELKALALPHARLVFELATLPELGPYGAESVSLLFSANPGSKLAALGTVASGGELSRVRLALEVTLASMQSRQEEYRQTFIFDEVDAGVGGSTALEIGRRLALLAQHSQVLVVTHLAQVAAFADHHFHVVKTSDGQITTSSLVQLEGKTRETELARMMGGLEKVDSAQAHAHDLLQVAQKLN